MKTIAVAVLAGFAVASGAAAKPRYEATIERTDFGIPHITASTWQGIGYGSA